MELGPVSSVGSMDRGPPAAILMPPTVEEPARVGGVGAVRRRLAQRSSTRIAIRRSVQEADEAVQGKTIVRKGAGRRRGGGGSGKERVAKRAGATAGSRQGAGRRRGGEGGENGRVAKTARSTTNPGGDGCARGARQHAAMAAAQAAPAPQQARVASVGRPKRASPRLSGREPAPDLKDASAILDQILRAKRARARMAASSSNRATRKAESRARQQQRETRQEGRTSVGSTAGVVGSVCASDSGASGAGTPPAGAGAADVAAGAGAANTAGVADAGMAVEGPPLREAMVVDDGVSVTPPPRPGVTGAGVTPPGAVPVSTAGCLASKSKQGTGAMGRKAPTQAEPDPKRRRQTAEADGCDGGGAATSPVTGAVSPAMLCDAMVSSFPPWLPTASSSGVQSSEVAPVSTAGCSTFSPGEEEKEKGEEEKKKNGEEAKTGEEEERKDNDEEKDEEGEKKDDEEKRDDKEGEKKDEEGERKDEDEESSREVARKRKRGHAMDGDSADGGDADTRTAFSSNAVADATAIPGHGRKAKRTKKKAPKSSRKPPRLAGGGRAGGVEMKFLKSLEAHGVPTTPTPAFYLPANQGRSAEDAAATGESHVTPMSTEGGGGVVWDSGVFQVLAEQKTAGVGGSGGGGGSAGCCVGSGSCDVVGSAQGLAGRPPSALKDVQDGIFDTLANPNKQKSLVAPQEYGEPGGYFEEKEQPFEVVVHPNVHFVADAHAYLMESNEVIGWLAGWYDEHKKVLYVQAAVPCKEDGELSSGSRGRTEVSMCQVSSLETSEAIRGRGLQVVGWYHSHPKFENDPSPIDVDNHGLFQKEEMAPGSCGAWVGLIVGRKTSPSEFRWLRNASVERVVRDENGNAIYTEDVQCPMRLRTMLASSVVSSAAAAVAAAFGEASRMQRLKEYWPRISGERNFRAIRPLHLLSDCRDGLDLTRGQL